MLMIFKKVSNQVGIRNIKNRIKGHLLELRLYKDDIGLSGTAMKELLGCNLKYLVYALKPMLVLMVPVLLILIQVASRYEFRPLRVGEKAIVTVTFTEDAEPMDIILDGEGPISVETAPLRIIDKNQISWRIRAVQEGDFFLRLSHKDNDVTKRIWVGSNRTQLASHRVKVYSIFGMLYPAETVLPGDSFLKDIHIHYPKRTLSLAGLDVHWLVIFFFFSLIAGVALKGVFGVEI